MDWIQGLSRAVAYMEAHLTDDVAVEDVARQAYTSSAHFQTVFHVVMGVTVGEYLRNRRLSLAAQELLEPGSRVIDVALRYGYDTPESFSKAFARFHGVPPSRIRSDNAKRYEPLTIRITIQGGFDMARTFAEAFKLLDWSALEGGALTDAEKYRKIVDWAQDARAQNPGVFDALTAWLLDDAQWTDEQLPENEQILMQGVLARFREQNARLRAYLTVLEPSGVVNEAVFRALDAFDGELSGASCDAENKAAVAAMFADFACMRERSVRETIAGGKTGPTGTDSVARFGYVNRLKECDAQVQWALFMPGLVEQQQKGFRLDSFVYKKLPAMRFIGREGDELKDAQARKRLFATLDAMDAYRSEFGYDVLLMHHNGLGVDVGAWHGVWGRFMSADAPVPEGFLHYDFVPNPGDQPGAPYGSQFAFATFSGDDAALHRREGYDSDAMYDVTRNIILGGGVAIPYPHKYWTAEVFLDGQEKPGTGYLFSAEPEAK